MSLLQLAAGGASAPKTYIDELFSAFTYVGNGSTQNIVNGIDLAGKGGMVWLKARNTAASHYVQDTARGANYYLNTDGTGVSNNAPSINWSFLSNGFSQNNALGGFNDNTTNYISWTFRKAPKFFDVVTYTGNGSEFQAIPHSLGSTPGFIICKRVNGTGNWAIYHRGNGSQFLSQGEINTTSAISDVTGLGWTAPTSTEFYPRYIRSSFGDTSNINGATYVAYLFAHDTSADGLIQCGSFTTDGSGNATVNLGWEPQYVLYKRSDSATGGAWNIVDSSRKFSANTTNGVNPLYANTSDAEGVDVTGIYPTATGFAISNGGFANRTYIYLAIRRPNKPPTSGTQVYNAIARTGTGSAASITGVGFAPDLFIGNKRATGGLNWGWIDRLRGVSAKLASNSTTSESSAADSVTALTMDGATLGADASSGFANENGSTYIEWFFRRAPLCFDEVCYTGTNTNGQVIPHNLGVPPELIIVKNRPTGYPWAVWSSGLSSISQGLNLNSTAAAFTGSYFGSVSTSNFTVGVAQNTVNANGEGYGAFLFATLPGISKCFSYTGNGSSQTINCGFTTGARFILVKASSTTGSWWVYDSTRGIIAAADPALQLNSTAAEVTADCVDTDVSGFIVNQEATCSINANGVTYIGLAFS